MSKIEQVKELLKEISQECDEKVVVFTAICKKQYLSSEIKVAIQQVNMDTVADAVMEGFDVDMQSL